MVIIQITFRILRFQKKKYICGHTLASKRYIKSSNFKDFNHALCLLYTACSVKNKIVYLYGINYFIPKSTYNYLRGYANQIISDFPVKMLILTRNRFANILQTSIANSDHLQTRKFVTRIRTKKKKTLKIFSKFYLIFICPTSVKIKNLIIYFSLQTLT